MGLADTLAEHEVHHPLQQVPTFDGGVSGGRDTDLHRHCLDRLGRRAAGEKWQAERAA